MKQINRAILIFLLFLGCQEEHELALPIVQTGYVQQVGSSGATFHGKVLNQGSQPIIDHGFVWDLSSLPTIEASYTKSLGDNFTELFSANITSALIPGETYYVRAYVRNQDQTVYGRPVTFESLGSNAPRIIDFNPKIATWGDTITIEGENFSLRKGENLLTVGGFQAGSVDESDQSISLIVPEALDTFSAPIEVSFLGQKAISPERFHLTPPQISGFDPEQGTYQTLVSILGNFFGPGKTRVYLDSAEAQISSITKMEIQISVPGGISEGEVDLAIEVAHRRVTSEKKFRFLSPVITNVSPLSGTWDDIISIAGRNFSKETQGNGVRFSGVAATVLEASDTLLKVQVPLELLSATSPISVTVAQQTFQFSDTFSLLPPQIHSFAPSSATFRDLIIVSGKNFHPVRAYNQVSFGDIPAAVDQVTATQMKVAVPLQYYAENGKSKIKVSINEFIAESEDDFELAIHSITDINPKEVDRNDRITLYGENLNPNPELNQVFVQDLEATVLEANRHYLIISLPEAVSHGNQTMKVSVAGRTVTSTVPANVYEPWHRLSNFPGGNRYYSIVFSIDGVAYVGGGLSLSRLNNHLDLWAFDPNSESWGQRTNMPFNRWAGATFSTSSKGYVVSSRQLWQYDPSLDQWNFMGEFPGSAYQLQSSFSIGNKGYVGTGYTFSEPSTTAEFWEYDEATNTWTQKADYPGGAITEGLGFSLGDKGYIAMGATEIANTDLYEYDPATDHWTWKLNLLDIVDGIEYKRLQARVFTVNGRAYLGAGYNVVRQSGNLIQEATTFRDIYEYDPATNTLRRLVDLPGSVRYAPIGFSDGNKGFLGTGKIFGGEDLDDFWEFDPTRIKP